MLLGQVLAVPRPAALEQGSILALARSGQDPVHAQGARLRAWHRGPCPDP